MKKTIFILIIILSVILSSCTPNNIASGDTTVLHETDTIASETETERVYFEIDENGDVVYNIRYIKTHINYPGLDRYAIRDVLMEVCETFVYPSAKISLIDYYDHIAINYTEIYNGFKTNSSYWLEIRDGYIVEISDSHIPIINPSPPPVVTPQIYEEVYKQLREVVHGYSSDWERYAIPLSEQFEIEGRYDIINDKYYLYATVPYTGIGAILHPDPPIGLASVKYYLN